MTSEEKYKLGYDTATKYILKGINPEIYDFGNRSVEFCNGYSDRIVEWKQNNYTM